MLCPEQLATKKYLADVDYRKTGAERQIADALAAHFQTECRGPQYVPYFILVGANSSTGDALGPFVGWFLQRRGFPGLYRGDLHRPVHATNLEEQYAAAMAETLRGGRYPLFMAVDAAVGRAGRITVNEGPLQPGAGVGKQLPEVGTVHVLGGTAAIPFGIWFASLDQTVGMAEIIANAIELMWYDLFPESLSAVAAAAD